MLAGATDRIVSMLPDDAVVLDVGGWGAPFNRADYILDLMPYETRGALGSRGPGPERFTPETWIRLDMCAHEPWPFEDDQFDFVVCSTTLEDIRDPIWVSQEIARVAKAGYIEVPTVLAEMIQGIQGPWLGHNHHRWICRVDEAANEVVFIHKSHDVHFDWRVRVSPRNAQQLADEEHLQGLFWEGTFGAREEIHIDTPFPLDSYAETVRQRFAPSPLELKLKQGRERARFEAGRAMAPVRRQLVKAVTRLRG